MCRLAPRRLAPLALALSLAVAACGGDSDDSPPAPPPTVGVFQGAIAVEGGLVVAGTPLSTAHADVVVKGVPGWPQSEIQQGRVARVLAVLSAGGAEATEVRIDPIFEGRAGRIATPPLGNSQTIDVRGQKIAVDDETIVVDRSGARTTAAAIVPDTDRIAVHGFPDDAGRIRATHVEILPGAADDFELRGYVSNLDVALRTFDLQVTRAAPASTALEVVLAPDASFPEGVADGAFVEVRSTAPWVLVEPQSPPPVVASSVTLEDATLGAEAEGAIEGIVASGDAASFVVLGTPVTTSESTAFENGARGELVPGARVEAEGTLGADGALAARKVSFRATVRLQGRPGSVSAPWFELLGLRVHVDEFTRGTTSLASPNAYEVRARRHANGADLVAVRIEDRGDDGRIELQGPVTSGAGASAIEILGIAVDVGAAALRGLDDATLDAAAFLAQASPGAVVKARTGAGFTPGTTFVAEEAELEGRR